MEKIVRIFMKRDDCTREEAERICHEVSEMISDALYCGDYELVEEIMVDELGLEMDYFFYFI